MSYPRSQDTLSRELISLKFQFFISSTGSCVLGPLGTKIEPEDEASRSDKDMLAFGFPQRQTPSAQSSAGQILASS